MSTSAADDRGNRCAAWARGRAAVPAERSGAAAHRDRQGHALVGRHVGNRASRGHLLRRRRRGPGRDPAHSGDRVPHPQHGRRRGGRDLRIAQPVSRQRHQVLRSRAASNYRTKWRRRSNGWCSAAMPPTHRRPAATSDGSRRSRMPPRDTRSPSRPASGAFAPWPG